MAEFSHITGESSPIHLVSKITTLCYYVEAKISKSITHKIEFAQVHIAKQLRHELGARTLTSSEDD